MFVFMDQINIIFLKTIIFCTLFYSCSIQKIDKEILIENIIFSANTVAAGDGGDNYICSYDITIEEIYGEYVTLLSANRNIYNNNNESILETSFTDLTLLLGDVNLEPLSLLKINESTEIGKDIFTDRSSIQWIIAGVNADLNAIIFSGTVLCQL